MKVKAIMIAAGAGAVAILAAILFLVSAAAADTSAAAGNSVAQRMPIASGQADMPADCPIWNDAGSAPAAGMHEQCQQYMSDSGIGHMPGMMNMMGNRGMNAMCGTSGVMGEAADDDDMSCPMMGAAEPGGDRTGMGVCHQTDTDN
jgi:hypothetical protein